VAGARLDVPSSTPESKIKVLTIDKQRFMSASRRFGVFRDRS
jgi:hypothetical protein